MSYDYGSQGLGIANPFRIEGAIIALRGLVVALAGFYALFLVANLVDRGREIEGWLHAGLGLLLVLWGLTALGKGLFKLFRFYVGRSAPDSLTRNIADPDQRSKAYPNAQELHLMMMGRKNTTFLEPRSLFSRMVHTLIPKLLFMPPQYRSLAENLFFNLCMTIFMLLTFALAWFASATGLARLDDTPVMAWLGLILTVYIVKLWWSSRDPLKHFTQGGRNIGLPRIGLIMGLAILLPAVLAYVHHNIEPIPELPIETWPFLLIILTLGLITSALGLLLLANRIRFIDPTTQVSEHRDNWQKNLMPRELFIHLDTHILANRRYREIPNRVYQNFEPHLTQEGGAEKGAFKGQTLVETQPIPHSLPYSGSFKIARILTTALGQTLIAASCLWLLTLIDELINIVDYPENIHLLMYPLILLIFGNVLTAMANAFWSEMLFRSLLLELSIEGTYTESRLSTGNSIYDSTRSENVVVRSTITPWFLVSELLTSTFTKVGSLNLEQKRYILSLDKDDNTLNDILDELDEFFDSRLTIAGVNEVDLHSASQIHQMNEQTRPTLNPQPQQSRQQLEAEHASAKVRHAEEVDSVPNTPAIEDPDLPS